MIDIKNESMYLYNCYFRNDTALFRYAGKLKFEYKDVLMYSHLYFMQQHRVQVI